MCGQNEKSNENEKMCYCDRQHFIIHFLQHSQLKQKIWVYRIRGLVRSQAQNPHSDRFGSISWLLGIGYFGRILTGILLPEKGYRLLLFISLWRPSIFMALFSIRGLAPGKCSVTHGARLLKTQLFNDVRFRWRRNKWEKTNHLFYSTAGDRVMGVFLVLSYLQICLYCIVCFQQKRSRCRSAVEGNTKKGFDWFKQYSRQLSTSYWRHTVWRWAIHFDNVNFWRRQIYVCTRSTYF